MFWLKRLVTSLPDEQDEQSQQSYIKFFLDDGDMKIEFNLEDIHELTYIADSVLNGRVRNSSIDIICDKLNQGSLIPESMYFKNTVNKKIRPSEYQY